MICLVVEHARDEVYGKLKKHLFEVKKGVYFGDVSGSVRNAIWDKLIKEDGIDATLVYNYNSEQGLNIRTHGDPNRQIVNDNGVFMVQRKSEFSSSILRGKLNSDKPLTAHLYETGIMAKALLKEGRLHHILKVLSKKLKTDEDNLTNFLCFMAASHDIGKTHPTFQMNLGNNLISDYFSDSKEISGFRHEEYGGKLLQDFLFKGFDGNPIIKDRNLRALTYKAIMLHHLDKKSSVSTPEVPDAIIKVQKSIIGNLLKVFPFDSSKISVNERELQGLGVMFTVIVNLSDWLASSEGVFDNKTVKDFASEKDYTNHLYTQAISFLKKHFLYHTPISSQFDIEGAPYSKLFGISTPREMQEKLIKICENIPPEEPTLIFIEDVCGGGKTEGSLYSAVKLGQHLGGIMDCLPTSATSEQLQGRVEKMFKNSNPDFKLPNFNSRAWLSEKDVSLSKELWLHPSRLKLLYPSAVGTVDQAIMTTQAVKYGLLRLAGYSDKVIIIDEMHSYDTYMLEFLKIFLEYCGWLELPVIILSATLPSNTKFELLKAYTQNKSMIKEELSSEYPLITFAYKSNGKYIISHQTFSSCFNKKYPYKLEPVLGENQTSKIVDRAIEQVKNGGCLDIIVNTVNGSQDLYKELKERKSAGLYDGEIYLIHGRFAISRKESDADKMLQLFGKEGKRKGCRPAKAIVISTQILEQSLDVDFDFTFTEICPIDLLIQRIGRQRRHDDIGTIREKAPDSIRYSATTILIPSQNSEYGPTEKVYEKEILDATLKVLESKIDKTIRVPEDIRSLIENVYTEEFSNNLSTSGMKLASDIYKIKGPYRANFDYFEQNQNHQLQSFAPTRLETYKTIAISIVPEDVFNQVKEADKELCKVVLKNYTYSIGAHYIFDGSNYKLKKDTIIKENEAPSFLKGTCILKADSDNRVDSYDISLIVDDELGLVITKKR